MNRLLKSKLAALLILAVIVALIILTFDMRFVWWMFADIFFAFMMAFSHLMALTVEKINPFAAKKLDLAALIFGVLFVIAFIVEYFIGQSF